LAIKVYVFEKDREVPGTITCLCGAGKHKRSQWKAPAVISYIFIERLSQLMRGVCTFEWKNWGKLVNVFSHVSARSHSIRAQRAELYFDLTTGNALYHPL